MQVQSINNTSFGAKLEILDSDGVLKGRKRALQHRLDKVRAFSEDELKQIVAGFEEKTKNLSGLMEISTKYNDFGKKNAREYSYLYYSPKQGNRWDLEFAEFTEFVEIKLLDNMPKSVEEFTDRLVGAFTAFKHRHAQSKKIDKLREKLDNMIQERSHQSISEIGEHFKPKNPHNL